MTEAQAYKILGIDKNADKTEIKKKYRSLIHKIHPDASTFHADGGRTVYRTDGTGVDSTQTYAYTVQELNEAYAFLCKNNSNSAYHKQVNYSRRNHTSAWKMKWNAPVNSKAYVQRNIYHYVENSDGSVLGDFIIDTGKYFWTPEEEFPLFMKSIIECSRQILGQEKSGEVPYRSEQQVQIQAELIYLLAQQFLQGVESLKKLTVPEQQDIYYIPAMVELSDKAPYLRAGMLLYPAQISRHRLYLKTKNGEMAGYLSFKDDRMYYIIIPLLENKKAQVKIKLSENQRRAYTQSGYKNLDFWVKILQKSTEDREEERNRKILELIQIYEGQNGRKEDRL